MIIERPKRSTLLLGLLQAPMLELLKMLSYSNHCVGTQHDTRDVRGGSLRNPISHWRSVVRFAM